MGLSVMILGLILFLGVHTLTTQRDLRAGRCRAERNGERGQARQIHIDGQRTAGRERAEQEDQPAIGRTSVEFGHERRIGWKRTLYATLF